MVEKKFPTSLDPEYLPIALVIKEMREKTRDCGQDLIIGCVRNNGCTFVYKTRIFPDNSGHEEENFLFVERLVKSIIWVAGGYKIIISGSALVGNYIAKAYSQEGIRAFDRNFMSKVYEKPFEVELRSLEDAPLSANQAVSVGRHLEGCRIGFDAGGSDLKVSAVIDGQAVFSEEVVWNPKTQSDPKYHREAILGCMKKAASKLPKVDGIGVSSAGIYIDNKVMVASLFIKVSEDDFEKHVKNMYIDIAKEIGENIPLEVANDGDVTALAGAMELSDVNILGIAMGTSEAGGYIDSKGNITGWLNELAFVPVDYSKNAPIDDWSLDYGCGSKYFSQEAIIKLAPAAGIELDQTLTPAEKLKVVQGLMEKKDERAAKIYETIGIYFGYSIVFYAEFYNINQVLIMGRVTSGEGGVILLANAQKVLDEEFPELSKKIKLNIPDEMSRRVGQSIAAASLPV